MSWGLLILAGLFEVGWAVGLKYSEGFTRIWPLAWTALSMAISLALLALAMRNLPLGTAYAVWTGIGTIGTVIFGILYFSESADIGRLACVGLIISGIIGLKLVSPS
jgi:quaternary ammonium compound-resistance protein SugE